MPQREAPCFLESGKDYTGQYQTVNNSHSSHPFPSGGKSKNTLKALIYIWLSSQFPLFPLFPPNNNHRSFLHHHHHDHDALQIVGIEISPFDRYQHQYQQNARIGVDFEGNR
jgi:hypothetical protein